MPLTPHITIMVTRINCRVNSLYCYVSRFFGRFIGSGMSTESQPPPRTNKKHSNSQKNHYDRAKNHSDRAKKREYTDFNQFEEL